MNSRFIPLALSNAISKLAEVMYLKYGYDYTRPVQIYGIINNICTAKCKMCDSWRYKNSSEVPAVFWIKALKSLKSFVGTFHISFSGGEPLLKDDLFEILRFCKNAKIMAGLTTNGALLNKKNIEQLIDSNLVNINISVDSMEESVHDGIRGVPGLLARVKENICYLVEQKEAKKSNIQIMLKSVVCAENLDKIDKIVEYAKEMNLNGVNFQPIFKWSEESSEMFKVDKKELLVKVEKLIEMKKTGYNILNSEASIKEWVLHFDDVVPKRNSACVVPLRNLTIKPNGDVFMCAFLDSKIGNIKNDDIKKIWYCAETKYVRNAQVNCKKLCTATCVVKRSWKDYARLFSLYFLDKK